MWNIYLTSHGLIRLGSVLIRLHTLSNTLWSTVYTNGAQRGAVNRFQSTLGKALIGLATFIFISFGWFDYLVAYIGLKGAQRE